MARIKIRRKDLRRPDEFVEVTGRVWEWLLAHRQLALSIAAATLLCLVAALGTQHYRHRRLDQAADAFRRAVALLAAGDVSAAVDAFVTVTDAGPYAALSTLYRGHAYLRSKEWSAAGDAFAAATHEPNLPAYLRQQAQYGWGFALDQAGNGPAALEHYLEAAALDGPYRVDARFRAAQLTEATGSPDEARTLYELAIEEADSLGTREDLLALARWRLNSLTATVHPPTSSSPSQ